MRIGYLYEKLRRRFRYSGATTAPMIFAITGIENALCDIAGKSLGVPVYQLLGGKFRDSIRLYADCHAGETHTPEAYAEKAMEVVQRGLLGGQVRRGPCEPGQERTPSTGR